MKILVDQKISNQLKIWYSDLKKTTRMSLFELINNVKLKTCQKLIALKVSREAKKWVKYYLNESDKWLIYVKLR
jgi:hypothetical protein